VNLLFRLVRVVFGARWRGRAEFAEETVLTFRVWPTDLDYLWHMNNGKYFALMDLGRFDMLLRTGFVRAMRAHKWYGVVASETMRFKRSLTPFQRFELRTRTIGWDDKSFYLQHTFLRRGEVIGVAVVRARFLSRETRDALTAPEVANAVSPGAISPPLPDYIRQWQAAEKEYSATPASRSIATDS